jgi:hypothetical protein
MKHVIDSDGTENWYDDYGKYHKEDGPAIIYVNGDISWYKHGEYHRLDGPAIIWHVHGTNYNYYAFLKYKLLNPNTNLQQMQGWFIEGINYSEEEFARIVKMKELL